MGSLISSAALLDLLRADVVAAWHPSSVSYGPPQVEQAEPYAVIRLGYVPMAPAGLRAVEQSYQFECVFVDRWQTSANWNVEVAKEEKANALIARLMASKLYAGSGVAPQVLSVDFEESDNPQNPRYSVTVTFAIVQHVEAI